MSLVINNNLMAMNATRNLNESYGKLATSTRRLSSGLRVGTAADDAAGLAMRELMRADIQTLGQGLRNANDGISMIQTADGALGVIDAKLIRMKELAEQAATGTYTDVQRKLIDQEYQLMAEEITRIAQDTDFNSRKLLAGTGLPISVEESVADSTTKTFGSIANIEGNNETWQANGLAPKMDVDTALEDIASGSPVDNVETYTNGGTAIAATGVPIKFASASGLKTTINGVLDANKSGTINHKTGVIGGDFTVGTNGAKVEDQDYILDTSATDNLIIETRTAGGDWTKIALPAAGASVASNADEEIRITAKLADGRVVRDTVTNTTAAEFDFALNAGGDTLTLSTTTNSSDAIEVTSDVAMRKDFEYTTLTGTKVSNSVTSRFDDATTTTNESNFTHNVKNGTIEDHAAIESTIAATYGTATDIPESIKVETFDPESGQWIEKALTTINGKTELQIDPDTESFRITVDYGDGRKTRDTISNNTGGAFTVSKNGDQYELNVTDTDDVAAGVQVQASSTQLEVKSDDLVVVNIHFGSDNQSTDQYDTEMNQVTARGLGIGIEAQDSVDTQENAKKALENLTQAIIRKDEVRAEIGSTQNRLAATIENVSIQRENLQASESRISDVDVATEMTEFNKVQIMTNAAVSMLAQANSLPKMAQKLLDAR